MSDKIYDLCVIGGGINGAGIARDAAGRGFSVALVEARDLAGATSSNSSKLIHGGLRYLEYYEFGLVRDSLREREILLSLAPHIIRPMKFILPMDKNSRPSWMIKAGLFLYDHLATRKRIPKSERVNLRGMGLKNSYRSGFSYYDCWADDARLVVLNAMDARDRGADIYTYAPCTKLESDAQSWIVHMGPKKIRAKKIINAAGPWAKEFLSTNGLVDDSIPQMRLVKGSHIIVKRQYADDHAFLLQQPDGRIVFVMPYEGEFTLIGTTEENYTGDLYAPRISDAERDYLCAAFNRAFENPISSVDIVWDYSGVRPLLEDGSADAKAVTREYKLHMHDNTQHPILSVFGGKLTTYRILAEKAVNLVFPGTQAWTSEKILPGGDAIDKNIPERYARLYGSRAGALMQNGLGAHYGDEVYEAEIDYLIKYEFAKTLDDILWRRTKLGLHISDETLQNLKKRFV